MTKSDRFVIDLSKVEDESVKRGFYNLAFMGDRTLVGLAFLIDKGFHYYHSHDAFTDRVTLDQDTTDCYDWLAQNCKLTHKKNKSTFDKVWVRFP